LKEERVLAAIKLLDRGYSVPFIARYRKEATESLDEVAITEIRDRLARLRELDRRRESILKSLEVRGLLTDTIQKKIEGVVTLAALEDIYLPYRPKRRTRATMAKDRGLEPLAGRIFDQNDLDPTIEAASFVNPERAVSSIEDALTGARDIMAEWICEDVEARARMRALFLSKGVLKSNSIKGKEGEALKYRDYFDWSEPLEKAPSHRIMAMMRAEKEGFLRLHAKPSEREALSILESLFIRGAGPDSAQVRMACQDGYKRLFAPSMERESLSWVQSRAEETAIVVFAENLRQLLIEPPLGPRRVLAIDPGFRTGCKLAVLDPQGDLLHIDLIYPHPPQKQVHEAEDAVKDLCDRFDIEFIAVGNGTAGRETEKFLRDINFSRDIPILMVDESGASIYSASNIARQEFPDLDVTARGTISIGRRLMDPLAELVKIDPKSIGVGQYQHDVDEAALKNKLEDVVTSCVNSVGVNLNTASKELLTYVSGLGPKRAESIVQYRAEHGPFASREDLKRVPRLGPKSFEQAAGFLRIVDGENPLDRSAVHPESYGIVQSMARDLGVSIRDLMGDKDLQKEINPRRYVTNNVGMPTLEDILSELAQPGRDPRQEFEIFKFASGVKTMEDLSPGMKLPGIVTNVTAFGAFVDVGVHQDGLVHISQLADRFVRDPAEVVKVHQKVEVSVLDVDIDRKRISLSIKKQPEALDDHKYNQ